LFGLSLLVPVASFAQDTAGCHGRKVAAENGKKPVSKEKKGHKGGQKGKKGTEKPATTPPQK